MNEWREFFIRLRIDDNNLKFKTLFIQWNHLLLRRK